MTDFHESEMEANTARRKEIDPALFYTPDLSVLPPFTEGSAACVKVYEQAKLTMICFKEPVSNRKLKMSYGYGQLENIAHYEENFQTYLKLLLNWAEELAKGNKGEEALQILEHSIELGSEFRKCYHLTADLYAAKHPEKLEALRESVLCHHFKDEQVRNSILNYISNLQ
jgi:hypothetical protein